MKRVSMKAFKWMWARVGMSVAVTGSICRGMAGETLVNYGDLEEKSKIETELT